MWPQVFKNMSHEDEIKSSKIFTNVLHGFAHYSESLISKFGSTSFVLFNTAILDISAATKPRERPKPWPNF
jgi:hypothetical protein